MCSRVRITKCRTELSNLVQSLAKYLISLKQKKTPTSSCQHRQSHAKSAARRRPFHPRESSSMTPPICPISTHRHPVVLYIPRLLEVSTYLALCEKEESQRIACYVTKVRVILAYRIQGLLRTSRPTVLCCVLYVKRSSSWQSANIGE